MVYVKGIDRDRDKSEGSYTSGLAHGMVAMSKVWPTYLIIRYGHFCIHFTHIYYDGT